ncbi:hypothetical protein ACLB1E_19275 [Escherichia coli]
MANVTRDLQQAANRCAGEFSKKLNSLPH